MFKPIFHLKDKDWRICKECLLNPPKETFRRNSPANNFGFLIFKDADSNEFYYQIFCLGLNLDYEYKGLKDSSLFAKAVFANAVIYCDENSQKIPTEHYCKLNTLIDVLDYLLINLPNKCEYGWRYAQMKEFKEWAESEVLPKYLSKTETTPLEEIPFEDQPSFKKGKRGEEILKQILEKSGYRVEYNPPGSLIDFTVFKPDGELIYIECKVRNVPFEYANGRFTCYTFPESQIQKYAEYSDISNANVLLAILNPSTKQILIQSIKRLMEKFHYEDKIFPIKVPTTNDGYNYAFFIKQFKELGTLTQEQANYIDGDSEKSEAETMTQIANLNVNVGEFFDYVFSGGEVAPQIALDKLTAAHNKWTEINRYQQNKATVAEYLKKNNPPAEVTEAMIGINNFYCNMEKAAKNDAVNAANEYIAAISED